MMMTVTNIEIEHRDQKTTLADVVIGNHVDFHSEESHGDLFDVI